MAKSNIEKFRGADPAELKTQSSEMLEQMLRLRLQINMGQSEGIKKYRELKRDRARLLTVLREREIEAAMKG